MRKSLLFDMQHDHIQINAYLTLCHYPRGRGECKDRMLAFKVLYVPYNLIWNMTNFKVKMCWPFDPFLSGQGCLCVLNNCYHVAVMCCSLKFYMQHDNIQKKFHFGLAPSPKSTQGIRPRHPIKYPVWYISYLFLFFYFSAYKVSVIILKIG